MSSEKAGVGGSTPSLATTLNTCAFPVLLLYCWTSSKALGRKQDKVIIYKRHKEGCQYKGKDRNQSHRCQCSIYVGGMSAVNKTSW